jgi:hypothetical protein
MWKKIFVTRLLDSSWLGVMREVCKGWKHAVSIVFHSVITSKKTEGLSLYTSERKFWNLQPHACCSEDILSAAIP